MFFTENRTPADLRLCYIRFVISFFKTYDNKTIERVIQAKGKYN